MRPLRLLLAARGRRAPVRLGPDAPEVEPCWNIAPTQYVPAVRADGTGYGIWLAPDHEQTVSIDRLLGPTGLDGAAVPVGRRVNNARNDGPDLVDPLTE